MHVQDALVIVGLVISIVELARSRGTNLMAWALGIVCVGLLWHFIG